MTVPYVISPQILLLEQPSITLVSLAIVQRATTLLSQLENRIRTSQPWMTAVPAMFQERLLRLQHLRIRVLPEAAKVATTEHTLQAKTRPSITYPHRRIVTSVIQPLHSAHRTLVTQALQVIALPVTMVLSRRVNQRHTFPPLRIAACAITSMRLPVVSMITRA